MNFLHFSLQVHKCHQDSTRGGWQCHLLLSYLVLTGPGTPLGSFCLASPRKKWAQSRTSRFGDKGLVCPSLKGLCFLPGRKWHRLSKKGKNQRQPSTLSLPSPKDCPSQFLLRRPESQARAGGPVVLYKDSCSSMKSIQPGLSRIFHLLVHSPNGDSN